MARFGGPFSFPRRSTQPHWPGSFGLLIHTMTTESNVSSGAETENTAPAVDQPEVTTPEPTDEASQSDAKTEKSAEQLEIERLRRQLTKRDRTQGKLYQELQAAKAELERTTRQPKEEEQREEVDVHAEARRLAREMREQEELGSRISSFIEKGRKVEGFEKAADSLIQELELLDSNGRPTERLHALLDVDDAHELLVYLAENPDVADSLADLPPRKFAFRLARVETQMREAKQPQRSKAPQPLKTVAPQASSSELSDDLPMSEWVKRREEQIKKRQGY